MTYTGFGRIIKSNGGLFTVRLFSDAGNRQPLDGKTVNARARGNLHRRGILLVGDLVDVVYDDTSFTLSDGETIPAADGTGIAVDRIRDRRCALIRPPLANPDVLFVTFAVTEPEPVFETIDKLISIAEYNRVEPVIVVTKSELSPEKAAAYADLYRRAGFDAFCVGRGDGAAVEALRDYLASHLDGKIAAFSGASGVGKSTLMNTLFPQLSLETGELSQKIERGKNTTRCVELYPLSDGENCGFLADTPGFTMLDFERFDFFGKEDLPDTFREFLPYIGRCRYTKCTHTKEDGCAILGAVAEGKIAASRHNSFLSLYEVLKKKTKW